MLPPPERAVRYGRAYGARTFILFIVATDMLPLTGQRNLREHCSTDILPLAGQGADNNIRSTKSSSLRRSDMSVARMADPISIPCSVGATCSTKVVHAIMHLHFGYGAKRKCRVADSSSLRRSDMSVARMADPISIPCSVGATCRTHAKHARVLPVAYFTILDIISHKMGKT